MQNLQFPNENIIFTYCLNLWNTGFSRFTHITDRAVMFGSMVSRSRMVDRCGFGMIDRCRFGMVDRCRFGMVDGGRMMYWYMMYRCRYMMDGCRYVVRCRSWVSSRFGVFKMNVSMVISIICAMSRYFDK